MTRPDFQRATVISCVAHLLFFLTALAMIGLRSPHKSRVYTISLVSPAGTVAPAKRKTVHRTPPPKKIKKVKMESPETRTLPKKEPAMAVKKEDPEISHDKAREAIEKLRQEQEAREAESQKQEHLKELQEKQRLEDLRNRLATEGASETESQIPEDERNDILNDYKNSIVPLIKENWVFPDVGMGTRTEVSITVFVDGTIKINGIITPSVNRAFDQSVLKAITKTGRVAPPPFGRKEDVTLNFIPVRSE